MFNPSLRSTGTRYTMTVAFLMLAFLFSPLFLLFSSAPVSLALFTSALCTLLAWVSWKNDSALTIPSIISRHKR